MWSFIKRLFRSRGNSGSSSIYYGNETSNFSNNDSSTYPEQNFQGGEGSFDGAGADGGWDSSDSGSDGGGDSGGGDSGGD